MRVRIPMGFAKYSEPQLDIIPKSSIAARQVCLRMRMRAQASGAHSTAEETGAEARQQ